MRLFFAAWPPAATARALAAWAKEARRQCGGRVVADANIHLTLAFLGEADRDRAIAAAGRVRAKRFELPIEISGFWGRNRIVWAGPRELPSDLAFLADALQHELRGEQFTLEERPFAAHITLLRKANAPTALPVLPSIDWPISEFLLMRSSLSREGSKYQIEKRFPLR